ncbi:MAG: pitrilysin family protein [Hyphomonadaceae bacterium]
MKLTRSRAILAGLVISLSACSGPSPNASDSDAPQPQVNTSQQDKLIPYESFTLDNGLNVIFHIDRSDPVVAVSLTAHVGSARELPGRTGFAHLFEHLLFLESENLGKGGLDKLSARIGGSGANGSTSRDRTNYLQTVPNNALERMLWAEADKLGWFINTVTDPVLAKEKQVVKNEKRQSYDNRPYGHLFSVLGSNLYPEDHPYNWEVIGSLEDLQAATLDDVKSFFRDWYTPNNVTLVIAGDFDTAQAREWTERYFAEIPRGPEIAPLEARPVVLDATKSLYHEDNFAQQPLLAMSWPTVEQYHEDSYALDILSSILTVGKRAPLNEVLIDEEQLSANVGAFARTNEMAGEWVLIVTAFEGMDLDDVNSAIQSAFSRFEQNGVSEAALNRVKIDQEVAFYEDLGSVLGKGESLAQYGIFAGDPGFVDQDLARIQAVTAEDVMRVYETYIKDRPMVAASFVPKGGVSLALDGSTKANILEEQVITGAEDSFDPNVTATYEPTPSSFDRSVEPPAGANPVLATPDIWQTELANGAKVFGIEDTEIPLVAFRLVIQGGHTRDTIEKNGAANMAAKMFSRGTANRTPAELQEYLADLGAVIEARVGQDSFTISGQALARNFDAVIDLLEEMLTQPRWDAFEFDLVKNETLDEIIASRANPNALGAQSLAYVTYGTGDIRAYSQLGSQTSVNALGLSDIKAYFEQNISPRLASFHFVGDVSEADVTARLSSLGENWNKDAPQPPELPDQLGPKPAAVYFYNVPGSTQSIFNFAHTGPHRTSDDYYPATVANYILGGGGFASRLTQQLRETKGYTYGIFSRFDGTETEGQFSIYSQIRSNVTLEAADLIRDILFGYGETFSAADLATTKSFFINSKARSFESYGAKLGMLANIDRYDLPYDYVVRENEIVEAMSVDEIQRLIETYIRPDQMDYVIVGDGATQLTRLSALGLGDVVVLNDVVDALSQ